MGDGGVIFPACGSGLGAGRWLGGRRPSGFLACAGSIIISQNQGRDSRWFRTQRPSLSINTAVFMAETSGFYSINDSFN